MKQEYEKADEKKRSVLRVFHTIQVNINELDLDQQGLVPLRRLQFTKRFIRQRLKWINDLDRIIETSDDLNKMMKVIRAESDNKTYKVAKTVASSNAMEWQ